MGGNATLTAIPTGPGLSLPGTMPVDSSRRSIQVGQAVRHDDASFGIAGAIGNIISPVLLHSTTPLKITVPLSALLCRIRARAPVQPDLNAIDSNGMSIFQSDLVEPCVLVGENANMGSWNAFTRFPNPALVAASLAVSNPNQVVNGIGPANTVVPLAIQGPGSGAFPIYPSDGIREFPCAGMQFFYVAPQGGDIALFFEFVVNSNS